MLPNQKNQEDGQYQLDDRLGLVKPADDASACSVDEINVNFQSPSRSPECGDKASILRSPSSVGNGKDRQGSSVCATSPACSHLSAHWEFMPPESPALCYPRGLDSPGEVQSLLASLMPLALKVTTPTRKRSNDSIDNDDDHHDVMSKDLGMTTPWAPRKKRATPSLDDMTPPSSKQRRLETLDNDKDKDIDVESVRSGCSHHSDPDPQSLSSQTSFQVSQVFFQGFRTIGAVFRKFYIDPTTIQDHTPESFEDKKTD